MLSKQLFANFFLSAVACAAFSPITLVAQDDPQSGVYLVVGKKPEYFKIQKKKRKIKSLEYSYVGAGRSTGAGESYSVNSNFIMSFYDLPYGNVMGYSAFEDDQELDLWASMSFEGKDLPSKAAALDPEGRVLSIGSCRSFNNGAATQCDVYPASGGLLKGTLSNPRSSVLCTERVPACRGRGKQHCRGNFPWDSWGDSFAGCFYHELTIQFYADSGRTYQYRMSFFPWES